MADTRDASMKETFWSRMETNSEFAKRMPEWVKGSPVNHRAAAAAGSASESPGTATPAQPASDTKTEQSSR
jgi:hypothetical protein